MKKERLLLETLDNALRIANELQDEHPELSRYEIGNIDEVISLLGQAVDITEHVEGNLKNPKKSLTAAK